MYFHLILARCTWTWVEEASDLVVARTRMTSRSARLLQILRFTSQQSSRQRLSVCTAEFVLFEGDTNNLAARHCSAGSRRTQSSTAVCRLFIPTIPLLTTSLTRSTPNILLLLFKANHDPSLQTLLPIPHSLITPPFVTARYEILTA